MSVAERSMGLGLRAIGALAGSTFLDRAGVRPQAERLLFRASRDGFRTATAAGRAFKAAQRLKGPTRQKTTSRSGLFDLTPTEEQQMLQEAFGDFATSVLRPAAGQADHDAAATKEILEQAAELGAAMLSVPEALGGAVDERSAVTSVLVAEKLAAGDPGLAAAVLAPAAVAGALSLWGDEEQQAKYLPAFTEDEPPAASLAILERRPLFDPFALQTTAQRTSDGWVLNGEKAMVLRAAEAELFIVAAQAGASPALFVVESGAEGLSTSPEPAMGIRAAATARLHLDNVKVPASAQLADGAPEAYAECIHRSRLAWCAITVGCAQAILDYVIPYVNTRQAFGEPISNRQAVAFGVSDISIELEGMRLATWRAASLADQGKPFAREAAVAAQLCAMKGPQLGSQGVQLLGGHGYIKEHPVERWYRDLSTTRVLAGGLLV